MSKKKRTTISLPPELVSRAKSLGINISEETQKHLEVLVGHFGKPLETMSCCCLCKKKGTAESNMCFVLDDKNDPELGCIAHDAFVCPDCMNALINNDEKYDKELFNTLLYTLEKEKSAKYKNDWVSPFYLDDEDSMAQFILEELKKNPLARVEYRTGQILYVLSDIDDGYKREWLEELEQNNKNTPKNTHLCTYDPDSEGNKLTYEVNGE